MRKHDGQSTFIKTPRQLIVVVALSFLVPIIAIVHMANRSGQNLKEPAAPAAKK